MSGPQMSALHRSFCVVLLMGRALETEIDRRADDRRRELEEALAAAQNTETEVAS